MAEDKNVKGDADAINDQMVRQMELRRRKTPERRRQTSSDAAGGERKDKERRVICSFCFQPGDHRTPAQCLRALGG